MIAGNCFFRGVPEEVVGEIGEGEKVRRSDTQTADAHLAEFDLAAEVVHLQQDAARLVAVLGIAAVGGRTAVHPGSQVVADRADAQADPLAVLRGQLRCARALDP